MPGKGRGVDAGAGAPGPGGRSAGSGYLCRETGDGCETRGEAIWVLDEPLVYFSACLTKQIVIPKGFETDLSSVPRIPFVFWFWGGRSHMEGVLHDYLYRKDSKPVVSFSEANKVFLEAMESRGKPRRVRYPMYAGVVIGGKFSYHKRFVNTLL